MTELSSMAYFVSFSIMSVLFTPYFDEDEMTISTWWLS